jgi:hypothetical protein
MASDQEVLRKFLKVWPIERLSQMTLDEYTLVGSDDSFTRWLESGAEQLGSIWGGSSFKFGVYRRKSTSKSFTAEKYGDDGTYAWMRRYGNSAQEAFETVKKGLMTSADAARKGDGAAIEAVNLSPSVKWKTAVLYQDQTRPVASFPIAEVDSLPPADAVGRLLSHADGSGITWDEKFSRFISFIVMDCTAEERKLYLEAAERIQTGGIRVEEGEENAASEDSSVITLPNAQMAMGTTRRDARIRLMRGFNTPFFPDVLVCSQVMGEGVDLQRFCCHVIHHDLAWNPSTIEQRTGRIDRLGSKAEGRRPINVYLPYLAGAADERQYRVMSDRERWFRVVMGEDKVAELITPDSASALPLPESIAAELNFHLGVFGS